MASARSKDLALELRSWAMTNDEGCWRPRAAELAAELGPSVFPVAIPLIRESIEPASVAFGARLLGEIDPARPELAYRAAGELACEVFRLGAAASEGGPRWGAALHHLLVAVARLPPWAGFDRLLGHSSSWVEGIRAGSALTGTDHATVRELAALARLDPSESVQVFVGRLLRNRSDEEARAAALELRERNRSPFVAALLDGRAPEPSRSAELVRWLERRQRASGLATSATVEELTAMLEYEDEVPVACEALAQWGEGVDPVKAERAARVLESVIEASRSGTVRSLAARARARVESGSVADRAWFLRFDEHEHIRRTLVHASAGDETRLSAMLDDPSDLVASWAAILLGDLEEPKDETVSRVLALAAERAGSEAAADAIFIMSNTWAERVPHDAYVGVVSANLDGGRWDVEVLLAVFTRPAAELVDRVRAWCPTNDYEVELRAEALQACEEAQKGIGA